MTACERKSDLSLLFETESAVTVLEIFKGRPMTICGFACVGIATAAYFASAAVKTAFAALLVLLLIFVSATLAARRIAPYRALKLIVCLASALCVAVSSYYFYDVRLRRALDFCSDGASVTGYVTRRVYSSSYTTEFEAVVESINGTECDIRAVLDCTYASDLQAGFSFVAEGCTISDVRDDEYLARRLTDGYFLAVESGGDSLCRITAEGKAPLLRRINARLSDVLRANVGGEQGDLAAAVLLGNKSYVDAETKRDFNRSGISHVLAVSGLHLGVIAVFFDGILRRLGVGKKLCGLLTLAAALAYLAVIDCPISALRSAIMLGFVVVGRSMGPGSDPLNSLGAAATFITAASPVSVIDAGFILSFAATLGIVVFVPYFEKLRSGVAERTKNSPAALRASLKLVSYALSSVSVSIFAHVFTIVAVWRIYGEVSLASVISNLYITPCASLLLILSVLLLIFSPFAHATALLSFALRAVGGFVLSQTSRISGVDGVMLSLEYDFVPYVILPAVAITFVLTAVKLKKRWICILPSVVAVLAFAVCLYGYNAANVDLSVRCISDTKNDTFVISRGGAAVICDVSDGAYTRLSRAAEAMREERVTEVDALVLTHLHKKHISSVAKFVAAEHVGTLYVPLPVTAADAEIAEKLRQTANEAGIRYVTYGEERVCPIEETELDFVGIRRIKRSTHPTISFSLTDGKTGDSLLYVGASAWESEIAEAEGVAAVVFGAHGPVAKKDCDFDFGDAKKIFVCSDKVASCFTSQLAAVGGGHITIATEGEINDWRYVFGK